VSKGARVPEVSIIDLIPNGFSWSKAKAGLKHQNPIDLTGFFL